MSDYEPQPDTGSAAPAAAADPEATNGVRAKRDKKEKRSRDPEEWIHKKIKKYRKPNHAREFRPDAAFFELADKVEADGRTLLGYDRLYVFWQSIRNLAAIPGAAAEIGSYRGGSAYFIAGALQAFAGGGVPFHVFDTFAGHPAAAISTADNFHEPGQFSGTSFDEVQQYLSPFPNVVFHRGDVLESLKGLAETTYRLVHIDTDLYLPTKACLDYFEPRLSAGGVVVLDDYASKRCDGVRAAVLEYLETTSVFQVWDLRTEQLVLVKR